MWRAEPGITLGRLQVRTGVLAEEIARVLKRAGIVTDRHASSGKERYAPVNELTDAEWGLVAGMLFSQKTAVYTANGPVRVVVTNARPERLEALKALLGVGEVNAFRTNGGKNLQHVYRVARGEAVKRILEEVRARLPVADGAIDEALGILAGRDGEVGE